MPCFVFAPKLPYKAVKREVEGFVKVQFDLDPKGVPQNFKVLAAQPEGMFESAALDSLSLWRFKALLQDGQVVAQPNRVYTFEFRFD